MHVEPVSAEVVRPLRQAVLRPHQRADELVYAGDDARDSLHAAVRDGAGSIVGVASVMRDEHPDDPRPGDWRLRGMATAPDARGRGIGAALLAACVDHARAHGAERVWCNARMNVRGFYERAGFAVDGGEFELPGIGPHVRMSRRLR